LKGNGEQKTFPFPYAGMIQIRFQGVISVPLFVGTPLTVAACTVRISYVKVKPSAYLPI
jgi:hypothetical protein